MTKYISILAVLAVVVAGFAYYTLFAGPNREVAERVGVWSQDQETEQPTSQPKAEEPRSGQGTLNDIREWGKDIECSVVFATDDFVGAGQETEIEGTYFVSNDTIRGDFLTPSPDLQGSVLTSMVIVGDTFYVWSEIGGEKFGVKGVVEDQVAVEVSQEITMDSVVNYDCKPWPNVDKTIFLPPSDVLFRDQNELLESGMEYGTVYTEEE